MNHRGKSFFEDTLIIVVFCALIYGLYAFISSTFFSSNSDNQEIKEKIVLQEKQNDKKEKVKVEEEIVKILKKDNKKKEIPNSETVEQKIAKETEKTVEKKQIDSSNEIEKIEKQEAKTQSNIEVKKEEIKENKTTLKQETIESFYKSIEKQIYLNINKNINKEKLDNFNSVDIRVTILKNGKYEQLSYIKGDTKYFNAIKNSIIEVFPLNINQEIKQKFPRYFRMKVQ